MIIVPAYRPYYVVAGTIGVRAAILFGLSSALRSAGWAADERAATVRAAAIILIGWFLLTTALASIDVYRAVAGRIPTIQYGILVPILIGGWLIWRSPRLAQILEAVPHHWLTGVQIYRALGVDLPHPFYGTGKLPGVFAWPAGLGDVLVGVLAPVVAVAYARDPNQNADLVSAWNLFGLADLVIAVAAGMLTSPSPLQLFAFDLPNELVSQFPLVFVPAFLVPVSVLLHLASLRKLRRDALARQQPSRNLTRSGVMQVRSMSKRSWGRHAGAASLGGAG